MESNELSKLDALKASLDFYVRYLDEHIEHERDRIALGLAGDDSVGSDAVDSYSHRLAYAAVAQSSVEEMQRVADTLRVIISEHESLIWIHP